MNDNIDNVINEEWSEDAKQKNVYGVLYIVSTPIGNLEDITLRALNTLKAVDLIAAEDTRHTIKLLNYFEIRTPLISYHEHNKHHKGKELINELKNGKSIALVSDAGTPAISDPGEDIVKLAVESNIAVTAVPGASAVLTALVLSGLNTYRFVFDGFLPVQSKERKKRIQEIKDEIRTIVIYEAPHKLKKTLHDLYEAMGDRSVSLARELTKRFEEVRRTTLAEAISYYNENQPKGEFVLVIEGKSVEELLEEKQLEWEGYSVVEHLNIYIQQGISKKDAMKRVAEDRGMNKRQVYSMVLEEEG